MTQKKKTAFHRPPKKEVKQNNNTKDQSYTIPEKHQPLSNDEKTKRTFNESIDDAPSVTQIYKQVNQKHKQNEGEKLA